jgi:peptidoglycan/xylan/chitin deacetylase (PgdA/CDA1 family)
MNTVTPFEWPHGKRAAVSFSFDDAFVSQIDTGIPIMDASGVRATFYVSVHNVEKRLEGWRKAIATGHEIGNHTFTHPCSCNFPWSRNKALEDFTLARMDEDLSKGDEYIQRQLGIKPLTFAYPCGQKFVGRGEQTASYVPLVARRFLAGRGYRDQAFNHPHYCDHAQLTGIDGDGTPFEELRAQIRSAVETGTWLIFVFHDIGDLPQLSVKAATLESLCKYVMDPASGVWVDTVAAVAKKIKVG